MARLPRSKMTPVEYREMKGREYELRLQKLPPSGGGGCHAALLGVATIGIKAGFTAQQIFDDLRRTVHGDRHVSDKEIEDAIRKAAQTDFNARRTPRYAPAICGDKARDSIIRRVGPVTEADLRSASPIKIDWDFSEDSWQVLAHLYRPDEYLFLGGDQTTGHIGQSIRTVGEWIDFHRERSASPFPKIIPNPLTGDYGITKDGKPSLRADSCIAAFRFIVCEFDTISIEDQLSFWAGVRMPIAAIIHSGKKSLHAWVRVDCKDAEEWEREVENKLFPETLEPIGLDRTCKNEARLSRMPGHNRFIDPTTSAPQRLLYLAPEGRPVHAR